ncbi:MAG: histidine phosphatase family protein, partial [Pseudomonadota bacterium]
MPYPDIIVLRHGQTEWNKAGRMQGQYDSPLTPQGIQDATKQQHLLQTHFDVKDRIIYSSPQPRALHTAGIVLAGQAVQITTTPALMEINVGDWAGRLQSDIRADAVQKLGRELGPFDHYDNTPGENFADLRKRCQTFIDGLDRPAILITHGVTSRV